MSMSGFNWMSILRIEDNGLLLPQRHILNFLGGAVIADDELNDRTNITVGSPYNASAIGTALTTDATPTVLIEIAIPNNYTGLLQTFVTGQKTDGTFREGATSLILVRNVGGVVTAVASGAGLNPDAVPWTSALSTPPGLLRGIVTGAIGDTIRWNAVITGMLNPGNA